MSKKSKKIGMNLNDIMYRPKNSEINMKILKIYSAQSALSFFPLYSRKVVVNGHLFINSNFCAQSPFNNMMNFK